jgi:hypothetical protein
VLASTSEVNQNLLLYLHPMNNSLGCPTLNGRLMTEYAEECCRLRARSLCVPRDGNAPL